MRLVDMKRSSVSAYCVCLLDSFVRFQHVFCKSMYASQMTPFALQVVRIMAWALGFSVAEELDMRKSMFIHWKGLVPVSSIWQLVTVGLTVQGPL